MEYQRRRGMKSKQENFQNNGGDELKDKLSQFGEDPSQSSTIFTEDDLKKATKILKNNLFTCKRGFGRVSKGTLPNKKSVAIKRSRAIDPNRREQFINMVLSLVELDQENVADFLGCCLETKEPLMVYESVDNDTTLFYYLHNNSDPDSVSWETCLRIAIEVAKALFYLHSRTPKIIHKDVKTSNILLDETLTAKLSGFGDSGLIPLDDTELATFVQESFGYLDPEYMQTRQLTEKSDVYSFGVVLVELLTGEKLFSLDRPEGEQSLIIHFLSCLKGNRLFEVLQTGFRNDKNNLVEIKKVAILAAKCLKLRGEERPSMKVVKMELEKIRPMGKHPLTNKSKNPEEAYDTREPGDRGDQHPWTNENQNFEEAHPTERGDTSDQHQFTNENQNFEEANYTPEHGDTSDQLQFTNENQNFEEAYKTEHDDTGDHQNA
ncbi:hypothetical protein Fmac_032301 [Flemingia macrophylla]|uniref:Protein kinase domain-containing protein n=1 Tax=Flemingia macrophylla TaxID=520843 RepID=A0ABD1L5V6_9FABA